MEQIKQRLMLTLRENTPEDSAMNVYRQINCLSALAYSMYTNDGLCIDNRNICSPHDAFKVLVNEYPNSTNRLEDRVAIQKFLDHMIQIGVLSKASEYYTFADKETFYYLVALWADAELDDLSYFVNTVIYEPQVFRYLTYLRLNTPARRREKFLILLTKIVRSLDENVINQNNPCITWYTLSLLIVDNLQIGYYNKVTILMHAVKDYLESSKEELKSRWCKVLEDIRLNAPTAAEAFQYALSYIWMNETKPVDVARVLHLHVSLATLSKTGPIRARSIKHEDIIYLKKRPDIDKIEAELQKLPEIRDLGKVSINEGVFFQNS